MDTPSGALAEPQRARRTNEEVYYGDSVYHFCLPCGDWHAGGLAVQLLLLNHPPRNSLAGAIPAAGTSQAYNPAVGDGSAATVSILEDVSMFSHLVAWVKQAVLKAVVAEIQEDFASAGYVVDVPPQLLLESDQPAAKRTRKRT